MIKSIWLIVWLIEWMIDDIFNKLLIDWLGDFDVSWLNDQLNKWLIEFCICFEILKCQVLRNLGLTNCLANINWLIDIIFIEFLIVPVWLIDLYSSENLGLKYDNELINSWVRRGEEKKALFLEEDNNGTLTFK